MGDRHVADVIPDEHERSWPRWVALSMLVLAGALLGVHAPGGPPRRPGRSGRAAGTVGAGTEGSLTAASLALLALGQDRYTVLLRPAPGAIATRRLQGCLQDTTTDQVQLQVVTVTGIGQPGTAAATLPGAATGPAQGADW